MKSKQDIDEKLTKLDYTENQHIRKISLLIGYWMSPTNEMNWSLRFNKCFLTIWSLTVPRLRWSVFRGLVSIRWGEGQKIMVNLLRLKDKQHILSSVKKQKGTSIYMNEDISGTVQQRRKELREKGMTS